MRQMEQLLDDYEDDFIQHKNYQNLCAEKEHPFLSLKKN